MQSVAYDPAANDRGLWDRLIGVCKTQRVPETLYGLVTSVDRRWRSVPGSPEIDAKTLALLCGLHDWLTADARVEVKSPPVLPSHSSRMVTLRKCGRMPNDVEAEYVGLAGDGRHVVRVNGEERSVTASRIKELV